MKTLTLIAAIVLLGTTWSQAQEVKKLEADDAVVTSASTVKINKGWNIGLSLGYNWVSKPLYDARISPVDQQLKITDVSKTSFLLSTGITIPLLSDKNSKHNSYYQKTINPSTVYYIPHGLNLVATVNLLTFSGASDGSVFNKKIDGGLGLGYRINDDVQLAVTYEMISVRQPRDFLMAFKDKQITLPGQTSPLTAVKFDDNDFFTDKYLPSISFKVFYLIRGSDTKETKK